MTTTDWHDPLDRALDDLEARIQPDVENDFMRQWETFIDGRFAGDIFTPTRAETTAAAGHWPSVSINEGLADTDAMALQQFAGCSRALASGTGTLAVRCNYGTSILPSVLGAPVHVMPDELDTLPTARPLPGGKDAIKRLLDQGVPDLTRGQGGQVLEMGRHFADIAERYPRIGAHVHIYHPDLQGPMDVCELIWGSALFYALVDSGDLVRDLLELICDTYISFLDAWYEIVPPRGRRAVHGGVFMDGRILLRDDSAMNLTAEMFDAFIRPYDARLLQIFDGGAIHFCGKGDHYIASASEMPGMNGINMSQPECNDMETIYRHTIDKGIPLLGLPRQAAEAALATGRDLHGRVHCG